MSGKRSCASSSRESIAMGQIARQPAKVIRCCDAPCGGSGNGWELCHKPTVITGEACTSSSKGGAAGRVWGPRETGAPAFYAFCRTLTLSHPRSNPLRCTSTRFASARNERWPGDIRSHFAHSAQSNVPQGMHCRTLWAHRNRQRFQVRIAAAPVPVGVADRFVRLLCAPSRSCDGFFTFGRRRLIEHAPHWLNGLTIPRIRSSP
ncbi:hypothetical protein FHT10_001632 [Xanthomonas arboricola]|nr:hypothetical protein [Xanthomonas cannabis]